MAVLFNTIKMWDIKVRYTDAKYVVKDEKANEGCKWSFQSPAERLYRNLCSPNAFHLVSNTIIEFESVSLPSGENECFHKVDELFYMCWASMISRYLASIILGSRLVLR